MINYYKCVTSSSNVLGSISIQDFMSRIRNGDYNKHLIEEARDIYFKDAQRYTVIKQNLLPCYTHNFTFNGKRRDKNILGPTGFIYLDIDGDTDLDAFVGNGAGNILYYKNTDVVFVHDSF